MTCSELLAGVQTVLDGAAQAEDACTTAGVAEDNLAKFSTTTPCQLDPDLLRMATSAGPQYLKQPSANATPRVSAGILKTYIIAKQVCSTRGESYMQARNTSNSRARVQQRKPLYGSLQGPRHQCAS